MKSLKKICREISDRGFCDTVHMNDDGNVVVGCCFMICEEKEKYPVSFVADVPPDKAALTALDLHEVLGEKMEIGECHFSIPQEEDLIWGEEALIAAAGSTLGICSKCAKEKHDKSSGDHQHGCEGEGIKC